VLPAVRLGLAAVTPGNDPKLRAAPPPIHAAKAPRALPLVLVLVGAAALALPLAWPQTCFGFAWLFLWPLCEAALTRLPVRALPSPLESLRARDRRLPLRLLALALPRALQRRLETPDPAIVRAWIDKSR
jgi:hypothetical protein